MQPSGQRWRSSPNQAKGKKTRLKVTALPCVELPAMMRATRGESGPARRFSVRCMLPIQARSWGLARVPGAAPPRPPPAAMAPQAATPERASEAE